jgi:hypothetical protein
MVLNANPDANPNAHDCDVVGVIVIGFLPVMCNVVPQSKYAARIQPTVLCIVSQNNHRRDNKHSSDSAGRTKVYFDSGSE